MSYQIAVDQWFCLPVVDVRDGRAYFSDCCWEELIIDGERVYLRSLDVTVSDRSIEALKLMQPRHVLRLHYMLRGDVESWEHDLTCDGDDFKGPPYYSHSYIQVYEIAAREGLLLEAQTDDELDSLIKGVLDTNPPGLADYRGGKKTAVNSLLGAVLRAKKGLKPQDVRERLIAILDSN